MHLTERIASAVPLYEEVLRSQPTQYNAVSALATAVHSLGDFQQALNLYAIAEEKDAGNVIMLANYAILLCEQLGERVEGAREKGLALVEKGEIIVDVARNPNQDLLRAKAACGQ